MIVLDASALIDVILDQPHAGWVLDEIASQDVIAPGHQPAEVLSALARLVRSGTLESEAARDALDEAMDLPQRLVSPTAAHVKRAYAMRERTRVVDGLYVALADEAGCPLVTTDRRLGAADAPCDVRLPPPGNAGVGPIPPPKNR